MINDLSFYQSRFTRALSYAVLIHFLLALLFLAKLPERPLDRLLAKLEQVAPLTNIVKQLRTQLANPVTAPLTKPLANPQLPPPPDDQVELHAAPLVATEPEQIYFISHIVQPGDKTAAESEIAAAEIDDDQTAPASSIQRAITATTEANHPETQTAPVITDHSADRSAINTLPKVTTKPAPFASDSTDQPAPTLVSSTAPVPKAPANAAPAQVAFAFTNERETVPAQPGLANAPDDHTADSRHQAHANSKSHHKPVIRALAPGAYLKYANAQGQHVMSQAGRKGTPTVADLRRLSYQALVMRSFSDAFNAYKVLFNITVPQLTVIYTKFVIDPTGQVLQVHTESETAAPELLEFVRKTIAYANPFPPVPAHMAGENYIFGPFVITLNPGKLAGQYVWNEGVRR